MKLEMRTVQKIAAAAMTLAVMFGCASPLKPLAASAAQNTVSVSADIDEENSYISAQDQMYQKDFLKLINKARAKAGLNSVELGDAAHNAAAAERAEELATTYSYVRPNGQRDFTVFAENGIGDVSVGENYLAGVSTPDSAMDQWMNLDFARERILNVDATTVSVGHYEGGAYGNYWVLIFSYPENSHTDDFRQEVLDLVNVERAKYGLTPLVMGDANLTAAAQKRAEEIATVNSHTRPDGSKCFTVLKEYGVTAAPTGENAAWGSVSPQEVVDAWMQSEGHRANILNPEARAMGVGYYYNSSSTWGHQWIQIFTKCYPLHHHTKIPSPFLEKLCARKARQRKLPGFSLAQMAFYVILILNNTQEEPLWRITGPSAVRPWANTKRRRAASLRSSPLRTARRPPWHSWSRCARPTARRGTTCMLTGCGRGIGNATPTMASRPKRPGPRHWRCCSTAA